MTEEGPVDDDVLVENRPTDQVTEPVSPWVPPAPPGRPVGGKPFGGWGWVLPALIGALIGGLLSGGLVALIDRPNRVEYRTSYGANTSTLVKPKDIQGILAKVEPAVVAIRTRSLSQDAFFQVVPEQGAATGMIVSPDGDVLTNAHVVENATDIKVTVDRENQTHDAVLVGSDSTADVALIHIQGVSNLPTVKFGRSANLRVGDAVVAIGNALNLPGGPTVTSGIVSALDRTLDAEGERLEHMIQTDAAVNPGNSGGPLVNGRGQVIGINQQIKTNSGGGEGVGFAVPSNAVRRSLDMLRRDGEAQYAYLGVSSVDLYPQLVERFELEVANGAWVQDVVPGGPADRAGLRGGGQEVRFQSATFRPGGDVITRVGETKIEHADDLAEAISQFRPGEEVPVEIHRGGDTRTIDVKLGERPREATQG
jgi:S1-C subfamily serine protease